MKKKETNRINSEKATQMFSFLIVVHALSLDFV